MVRYFFIGLSIICVERVNAMLRRQLWLNRLGCKYGG
jgi:hypothetical protein